MIPLKIKWEDYRRLNKFDREEYDFKFGSIPRHTKSMNGLVIFCMMWTGVVTIQFLAYGVLLNTVEFANNYSLITLEANFMNYQIAMITGFLVIAIIDVFVLFYRMNKRRKFIIERAIK